MKYRFQGLPHRIQRGTQIIQSYLMRRFNFDPALDVPEVLPILAGAPADDNFTTLKLTIENHEKRIGSIYIQAFDGTEIFDTVDVIYDHYVKLNWADRLLLEAIEQDAPGSGSAVAANFVLQGSSIDLFWQVLGPDGDCVQHIKVDAIRNTLTFTDVG